jgi:hypothetical protein
MHLSNLKAKKKLYLFYFKKKTKTLKKEGKANFFAKMKQQAAQNHSRYVNNYEISNGCQQEIPNTT